MKSGVLLLSFTILFQSFNFEINDVFKFSALMDHLQNHLEEGDNIADFVDLHYGNKADLHKNKHKEHKKLPFKQHHIDVNFQYFYPVLGDKTVIPFIEIITVKNNFRYKDPSTNSFINSFFQPPQK